MRAASCNGMHMTASPAAKPRKTFHTKFSWHFCIPLSLRQLLLLNHSIILRYRVWQLANHHFMSPPNHPFTHQKSPGDLLRQRHQ
jgi:hypothetical protein